MPICGWMIELDDFLTRGNQRHSNCWSCLSMTNANEIKIRAREKCIIERGRMMIRYMFATLCFVHSAAFRSQQFSQISNWFWKSCGQWHFNSCSSRHSHTQQLPNTNSYVTIQYTTFSPASHKQQPATKFKQIHKSTNHMEWDVRSIFKTTIIQITEALSRTRNHRNGRNRTASDFCSYKPSCLLT